MTDVPDLRDREPDKVDRMLAAEMVTPRFAAAYADAAARSDLFWQLIRLRNESGRTQDEVAALMELPVKRVVAFEDGATDPYWSFLQRYARAIGVRVVATVEAGDG